MWWGLTAAVIVWTGAVAGAWWTWRRDPERLDVFPVLAILFVIALVEANFGLTALIAASTTAYPDRIASSAWSGLLAYLALLPAGVITYELRRATPTRGQTGCLLLLVGLLVLLGGLCGRKALGF